MAGMPNLQSVRQKDALVHRFATKSQDSQGQHQHPEKSSGSLDLIPLQSENSSFMDKNYEFHMESKSKYLFRMKNERQLYIFKADECHIHYKHLE